MSSLSALAGVCYGHPGHNEMTTGVRVRAATECDISDLAYVLMLASGGVMEAIYHEAMPGQGAKQVIERLFSRVGASTALANCWIAEYEGQVVGGLNAFSLALFDAEPPNPWLRADRHSLLTPFRALFNDVGCDEAYYVRAVAVYSKFRGLGVGDALMAQAHNDTRINRFSRTCLAVFADNTLAVEFYRRLGYTEVARHPAPTHRLMRYQGDTLLLVREL
jgi:ribosomal protein S18 acetylase RimI-like enzyme